MSRYNRCKECFNMECVFVTGEREDFDTSECPNFRPMTNADRIRQMTDEELAEFLAKLKTECYLCPVNDCKRVGKCSDSFLGWLKQEVTE